MADDTRRDVLSAAFDQMHAATETSTPVPEPAETTVTPPPAQETGAPTSSAPDRQRDDQGRFTKADASAEKKSPVKATATSAPAPNNGDKGSGTGAEAPPDANAAPATPPAAAAPEPTSTPTLKAPQSWKPAAREKWAALPPDVQAEVVRVDREIRQTMQRTAEKEKAAETWTQTVAPFEQTIRARGLAPQQVVTRMLQTEHALQYGSPQQKAQLLAQAVRDYGVDIGALDQALSGQSPNTSVAMDPDAMARQIEQRIQQRIQQQAEQAREQKFTQTLAAFAEKHEFYEDVRNQMADVLQARGIKAPTETQLEDAYNIACLANPDVAPLVEQRRAAKVAQTAKAATERAMAAASSVRSTPAGAAPAAQPKGRRQVLESAVDEYYRSR